MIDNYGGSDVWNPRGETSPLRSYWGSDIAKRDINYSVPGPGSQNPRADIAANFRWSADPNRDYVPYNDNQMRSPLLEQAYGDQDAAGANREKLYPNFYGKAALDRVLGRTPPQPFVTPSYPGSNPWSGSSAMSEEDLKAGSLPGGGNQRAVDDYWYRIRGATPETPAVSLGQRYQLTNPPLDSVQPGMSPGALDQTSEQQAPPQQNALLRLMMSNPQLYRALMSSYYQVPYKGSGG